MNDQSSQLLSLPEFGFLAVTGRDASKFMQGYATCDLNRVAQGEPLPAAICNIKGRMITSFRIAAIPDGLLLRMHSALVPETIEFLSKYIVFSKAEMADVSDTWHCYGCMFYGEKDYSDESLLIPVSEERAEIWSQSPITAANDNLIWQQAEIAEGLVWLAPESVDTYLPQMLNYHQLGAIDFEKGCYLGQEIVARMQYRGELKRRLYRGTGTINPGETLKLIDGSTAGIVVRSAADQFLCVLQQTDPKVEVRLPAGETATLSLA